MPWRYPAVRIAGGVGVGRIKGRFEAVAVGLCQFDVMNAVIERGKHNLGRERQRRRHGPRRDRAVVGVTSTDYQRLVEVVVKIDLEGNIENSIVTQLKAAGITGIVFVELDRRQPEETVFLPPAGMNTVYPVIPSQPSQTKQMLSSIDRIMEMIVQVDVKGISDQIRQTSRSMETFFTGKEMTNIVRNLDSTTAGLDSSLRQNRPDPCRRKGRIHPLDGGTGTW